MSVAYRRSLQAGLALQPTLSYARPTEVRWTPGSRVPSVVPIPSWSCAAPLDVAALAALVPAKFRLPDEVAELYTKVGDGFRAPSVEFPPAAVLIANWVEARGDLSARARVLVRLGDQWYFAGFIGRRCEIWLPPDGISDDDRPRKVGNTLGAWLGAQLREDLAASRKEIAVFEALQRKLKRWRWSGNDSPERVVDACEVVAEASPYPSLQTTMWSRFETMVAQLTPRQLDGDAARRLLWLLFERCTWSKEAATSEQQWELLSKLADKTAPLLDATDPGNAAAFVCIAHGYMRCARREAIEYFDRAIALGIPNRFCDRARAYAAIGDLDEAERRLLEGQQDDSYVQTYAGEIKLQAGKLEEAETALKWALELMQRPGNPFMGEAYLLLGELYLRQSRLDEAEEIIKPKAGSPAYYRSLARILDARGDIENAQLARDRGAALPA